MITKRNCRPRTLPTWLRVQRKPERLPLLVGRPIATAHDNRQGVNSLACKRLASGPSSGRDRALEKKLDHRLVVFIIKASDWWQGETKKEGRHSSRLSVGGSGRTGGRPVDWLSLPLSESTADWCWCCCHGCFSLLALRGLAGWPTDRLAGLLADWLAGLEAGSTYDRFWLFPLSRS